MNIYQGLFLPLFLGVVEGLTEFIPVSSTGHLLLLGHFLKFDSPGHAFEVLIQLGSVLGIVAIYFTRFVTIGADAIRGDRRAWHFIVSIVIGSIPAALAGVLLHDFIKNVLYENPLNICVALIVGGIILLFIEQLPLKPRYGNAYELPLHVSLLIGLFQMLALVPGVSRSGATIVGSLLLGTDKRTGTEFSFFLAVPVMIGAFGYDFYKNRQVIMTDMGIEVAIGFAAAFVVGALVVRYLLNFVSRRGFAPFAYWRIFAGALGLWALLLIH